MSEHINAINAAADAASAASAGTMAKVSLGGGLLGGAMSFVAWIETSGMGTVISLCIVAAGAIMSWYYSRKKFRLESKLALERAEREQEIHDARMLVIEAHTRADSEVGSLCNGR